MAGSLLKSTSIVGSMTLVSRVLGFIRDQLQARLFGAGAAMDVFFVAFRIPNLFRRLFAEGAFTQAFVPVLSEARATRTPEEVRQLVDVVAGTLGGVMALIGGLAVIGAPLVMFLFAPGFAHHDPAKFALGVELLRWTFPYLPLISLTAFLAGILNAHGRFAEAAFNPAWMNVCLIAAAWWFAPSVEALAIGVLISGVVQLAFLLPSVARLGLLPRPRWGWSDPEVRRIIGLMLPIAFGSSVSQLSLLLDTVIASFLPGDGNVSWLWYADRLMEFPLGTFSVAIATVILPSLARQHSQRSEAQFSATLDWGLRVILVIGVPATLGLFLLAGPLVSTLFQSAAFTAHSVRMTAWALMAYATGFLGFSLVKILVPGFYARQETRIPVRYAVVAFVSGMAASASLTLAAIRLGFVAPHAAIAVATSAGAWINAMLLLARLRRDRIWRPAPGWDVFALRLLAANGAMAALLLWLAGDLESWITATFVSRAVRLAAAIAGGMALYFAVLAAGGLRLRHFRLAAG
ncbi:MAG TPA: murein biosynthesis integral membrane protein MurJ [Candidatus Binatia bacterium]|nr:murein biosynthesis integral membrane protein MurJ [Candidatus Binatia bacterium]